MNSTKRFKLLNERTKYITAATTLTNEDSGSTIIVAFTADAAITMPSAVVGLRYNFFVNCTGFEVRITPATGEYMTLHTGATQVVSKYVNNVGEIIGENFTFECFLTGIWSCTNAIGTLEAQS